MLWRIKNKNYSFLLFISLQKLFWIAHLNQYIFYDQFILQLYSSYKSGRQQIILLIQLLKLTGIQINSISSNICIHRPKLSIQITMRTFTPL